MLETVFEPVFFRFETDQHARRLAVAGDNDLLRLCLAKKPRQIVLDFGQWNFLHSGSANCASHDSGLRFGHDRQNLDGRAGNIIEHPNFADAQPILRAEQSSQPLDATTARFLWLVSQMRFERSPHGRPNVGRQPSEVFDGFGGENDGERHSGQIIARFAGASNPRKARLESERLRSSRYAEGAMAWSSVEWRATVDEDGHYSFAVAL